MKRLAPIIFSLALFVGILAPVTFSLTLGVGNQTSTVTLAPQHALAQTQGVTNPPPDTIIKDNISCGVTSFTELGGCLEWFFYFIPYSIGGWLMQTSAWIFDQLAAITLSSTFYNNITFITDGWRIVRDFSNIFFILILLFIAISLVLNMEFGHANPKKMLGSVIAIALFINFSFFITEVVIDLSNSLALVFYNQITVLDKSSPTGEDTSAGKPISQALVNGFTPQILQSADFWENLKTTKLEGGSAIMGGLVQGITGGVVSGNSYVANNTHYETTLSPVVMIGILILIGVMYAVVAYAFFVASLAFLGRLIGLWILIVFAPFAFVSFIIPGLDHAVGEYGWTGWWKKLIELAFAAPIFLFFLLLISLMTKSSIVNPQFIAAHGSWAALIVIMIAMLLFVVILLKATKYVTKASGELGGLATKLGMGLAAAAGGLALGTVAGAAAVGGRKTFGALGNKMMNTQSIHDRAANLDGKTGRLNQWIAKQQLKAAKGATTSSFDLRQNKAANALSAASGMNLGSFGAFATTKTAGGREGLVARKAAEENKFKEILKSNKKYKEKLEAAFEKREDDVDEAQEQLRAAQEKVDAIKRASEMLKQVRNGGAIYDDAGTLQNEAWAQGELSAAELAGVGARQQVLNSKKKLDDLTKGERDATTGKQIKYTAADIANPAVLKADGTRVTAKDVAGGAIRKESLSMADLKKLSEEADKVNARAYMHDLNVNSGYGVHHIKYDKLGNVKSSHIDTEKKGKYGVIRGITETIRTTAMGTALGAAVGTAILPGLGTAVGAAVGGSMSGLAEAIRGWVKPGRTVNADVAHHVSDVNHKDHEIHSVYQGPNSGFFNSLKEIFKSGAGGGGGHGGGGGGAHGGGHH